MTTSSPQALKVTGLRKAFGDKTVLDGIDLDIAEATTFCLLGPNGAGKTTTVQILSTLLRADAGEVQVAGFDVARQPDAVRAAIGVTGQFSAVDNLLTGRENLMLMADLHHLDRGEGRRRTGELLERFDLVEAAGQMVATFSGGVELGLAIDVLGATSHDEDGLSLQIPTDGTPESVMTLLERLRHHAVGVERVTVQTTDLDDVFFALTSPKRQREDIAS